MRPAHCTLLSSGNRLRILSSATFAAALRIPTASSLILSLDGSLSEHMFYLQDSIFGRVHINLPPARIASSQSQRDSSTKLAFLETPSTAGMLGLWNLEKRGGALDKLFLGLSGVWEYDWRNQALDGPSQLKCFSSSLFLF